MTTAPTINTYLSDMLALSHHIAQPLDYQERDLAVQAFPNAQGVIADACGTINRHITALDTRLKQLGGHSGSPVKNTVSSILGVAATLVDNVRKTEVSKDLRDDYAALCMASASYTMLHTTALGLHDQQTADLAKLHLSDIAELVMRINAALPVVVLEELRQSGVNVDTSVAQQAEENSEQSWRNGSHLAGNHT